MLEWYVYRYDWNTKRIYHYNIFEHYYFFEDCCKLYKKYKKDLPKFIEELMTHLQYYMWSKYEYEVLVTEFSTRTDKAEIKIDAYKQVMMNQKAFENYIMQNLDKFKITKYKQSTNKENKK